MRLLAYIDPANGSFAVQAVAGAVLGGSYLVRNRIKLLLAKFKRETKAGTGSQK